MKRRIKKINSLEYLRGEKEIPDDIYYRSLGFKKTYFYKKMNGGKNGQNNNSGKYDRELEQERMETIKGRT